MTQYAVIQTGGKQHLVQPGKTYRFEKLAGNPGEAVTFDRVLLTFSDEGGEVNTGTPTLSGVTVVGKILRQGRAKKITVVKYKAKSRYRRKRGHRQHFTEAAVETINVKP